MKTASERFLEYVKFDTMSDEFSETCPSTDKQKVFGAYAAALNGVDVITFTAGVGENGPETREAICSYLGFMGVEIDAEKNNCRGKEVCISTPSSMTSSFPRSSSSIPRMCTSLLSYLLRPQCRHNEVHRIP